MSAIVDTDDAPGPVINVLFVLYPGFDILDVTGPLAVLSAALHNMKDSSTKAFKCDFVSPNAKKDTKSAQGVALPTDMDYDDANDELENYELLIVPGGEAKSIEILLANAKNFPTTNATATAKEVAEGSVQSGYVDPEDPEAKGDPASEALLQPLGLIRQFAELQKDSPDKERTLMAVGSGSLLLAQIGLLQGFGATTHPDHYTKFELICQDAARRGDYEQTDVMEERYVVNNARFLLHDGSGGNPFIHSKRPDGRRKSMARKGSQLIKRSNTKEHVERRTAERLGGLRLITSGGTVAGIDVALYIVAAMVSHESAEEVARLLQYKWEKGVTVDGIDV